MARRPSIETSTIDQVFRHTLAALQEGRARIFEMAAISRDEYRRLQRVTDALKREAAACAERVDRLERARRLASEQFAPVCEDVPAVGEAPVRAGDGRAEALEAELAVVRTHERLLVEKGDELGRSLTNLRRLVNRAEAMVSQVSVAMEFLADNLEQMATQFEGLKARHQVGERIICVQEEERRRVAREIHDGPAQAMANVVLRAEICERLHAQGRQDVADELGQLKELVKDALRELRKIIFNLRPMALDDLGLVPTLYRHLTNLREQEGVPVHFELAGEERRLAAAIEVALFRLAQEAVNNARKHAQARRIEVRLEFGRAYVRLVVSDDGVGFDPAEMQSEAAQRESFGLLSMKERIDLLDGEFEVSSAPGQGTRVAAYVPLVDADILAGAT